MTPDKLSWAFLADGEQHESQESTVFSVTPIGSSQWRELLLEHMPFHHVPEGDRARLLDALRVLEQLFLTSAPGHPQISAYYKEAWLGVPLRHPDQFRPPADVNDNDNDLLRHVVHLQARLMEQAVETLRLDRYANAPPNRGWMNLFRRWGTTWTYNYWFDELRDVFACSFVNFYDDYVRYIGERIDEVPLRHPWDGRASFARRVVRLEDETLHRGTRIRVVKRQTEYPGLFLDSGILEQNAASASEGSIAPSDAPPKEGHTGDVPPEAPRASDHPAPNA